MQWAGEGPPPQPTEPARSDGSLAPAWKAWMRASDIQWRPSRATVDVFDDPQSNPPRKKGQPAATWKLEGNIDVRNATQTDLYTRREFMDPELFERRVRDHFFVVKDTLRSCENKLKNSIPDVHECIRNLRFQTLWGWWLKVASRDRRISWTCTENKSSTSTSRTLVSYRKPRDSMPCRFY